MFVHLHYSCCCVASCLLHVLKVLPARILGDDDDGVDDDDDGGGDDDDGIANNSHS